MIFPMITSTLIVIQKQALIINKVSPMDFAAAYFGLAMFCYQIYGIYSLTRPETIFILKY